MKRVPFALTAVLALAIVGSLVAQSQESYPTATANQQQTGSTPTSGPSTVPVDQQQTTTTDPATQPASSLPATASPLPLIGLGGLVSLAAGLWVSRSRRRA